jgi:hypothetical protein
MRPWTCALLISHGSGAGVEISQIGERAAISFRFSALAGAFVVGIAGAKWLTSEVDKKLLAESSPMEVLNRAEQA